MARSCFVRTPPTKITVT